jgi:SAM-dependent methyltransferase
MDPLSGTPWNEPRVVAGFTQTQPNAALLRLVEAEGRHSAALRVLDIGCGAGRNALPIARLGCHVLGLDLSWPMLQAARTLASTAASPGTVDLALAPMDALPVATGAFDLVIAHGIWNLARSSAEFRRAVAEAARAARPGVALFVFTFSRATLPPNARPIPGERHVFTDFAGTPQLFLEREELVHEMGTAGFVLDPVVPLQEHNRPRPGLLATPSVPVIYEAVFRRVP